jgi:hypothetical protein
MQHSILAPSSAARRVACPGSRKLEAMYPQDSSEASQEGEAAHWVAAEYVQGNDGMRISGKAPNGVTITDEMLSGAALYAECVHKEAYADTDFHIEETIAIPSIHADCFGTPDLFFEDNDHLVIFDYKFGFTPVEAFENWQLIEYAAGILEKNRHCVTVSFHIVQPRCYSYPVKKWFISVAELEPYFNQLRVAESVAMQDDAPCIPSPQCKHCKARHACASLQSSALSVIEDTRVNQNQLLTPLQLGQELRVLHYFQDILKARINGLEAEVIATLAKKERVPFYSLEQGFGRERWKEDPATMIATAALLGVNIAKAPECITPKQAVKAGLPRNIVDKYSETPPGELKLIKNNAARLFGGAE